MKNYIFTLLVFVISIDIYGQSKSENNTPNLFGHYFITSTNTPNPFIQSQFGLSLGGAASNDFENIIIEIDGEPIVGLSGSLIFADLTFEYKQKMQDWIALELDVGVTARVGTDVQSLLSQGLNTVVSYSFGWSFKLYKSDRHYLSGDIKINNHTANVISISDFVDDIIAENPNPSITKSVPILYGNLGARYAYAISKVFGVQAFGSLGYGEGYRRGESSILYFVGAFVDANLATTTKVPLGFALFSNFSARPDLVQVEGRSALNNGIKISYTGGPHFNLGIELSSLRVPLPNLEDKVTSTSASISCIYYFN